MTGDVALKAAPESASTHWYPAPQPVVTPAHEELKTGRTAQYSAIHPNVRQRRLGARRVSPVSANSKARIVHALRGKEHVEYDNPYDVGMTGLIGFSPASMP
ncbi:hypothetical protein ACNKHO_05360 [Shigella flexneri]